MSATTDRPLRVAFVGQSTYFEACVLDTGTLARFDTHNRTCDLGDERGKFIGNCL